MIYAAIRLFRVLWGFAVALLEAGLVAYAGGRVYGLYYMHSHGMTRDQAAEDYGLMAQTVMIMGASFFAMLVVITLVRLATSKTTHYTVRGNDPGSRQS